MPVAPTYPGVYIEEIPSGVRTIVGVATSITAFLGRAVRGPVNEAVTINNFSDFERRFGGLHVDYPMSYAVRDFYLNGGSQAVIVRLYRAKITPPSPPTDDQLNNDLKEAARKAAKPIFDAARGANDSLDKTKAAEALQKKLTEIKEEAITPQRALEDARRTVAEAQETFQQAEAKFKEAAETLTSPPSNGGTARSPDMGELAKGLTEAKKDLQEAIKEMNEPQKDITKAKVAKQAAEKANKEVQESEKINQLPADEEAIDAILKDIVEAASNASKAASKVPAGTAYAGVGEVPLSARSPGVWANNRLIARVDRKEINDTVAKRYKAEEAKLFNLTILQEQDFGNPAIPLESFRAVSIEDQLVRRVDRVLEQESSLVRFAGEWGTFSLVPGDGKYPFDSGDDGEPLEDKLEPYENGINALDKVDLFNLVCIPPDTAEGNVSTDIYSIALKKCVERRAMLIVDPPKDWKDANDITSNNNKKLNELNLSGLNARNAAIFFPRVLQANPLRDGQIDTFVPCGLIAGVMARTDVERGVWKAPAGIDATLNGIRGLEVNLTDAENGMLNPLGINCLRSFPVYGKVVWGARTLRGADQLADEYKYIPVRRTALFIEESLFRGLKWVVFEPNDEPLWAQIRLNVGAFMHNLFRQGAFQGQTPREAYFVKCDKETTTQNDINLGIVNVVVGFAPLKPAEFVIIKLQQIAGQIEV